MLTHSRHCLNSLQPLTEEAKAFHQSQVDEVGNNFVRAVARGRRVSESTVRSLFGKGRVLLASAAHRVGMVDGIETFATALGMAPDAKRRGPVSLSPSAPARAASFTEMSTSQRRQRLEELERG